MEGPEIAKNQRQWAAACYIPVFGVIACCLCAVRMVHNKFCLFHARQGLVLFGLIIVTVLSSFFSQTLSLMLWGVALLLHIAAGVMTLKGKMPAIPVINSIAMLIPEDYLFKILTGRPPDNFNKPN